MLAAQHADLVARREVAAADTPREATVAKLPALPVTPRVTPLEMTLPWLYCTWDRKGEGQNPGIIPEPMAA
jgi:hypothetical protein